MFRSYAEENQSDRLLEEMKEKKPSETTTIRITYRLKAELDKLVEIKTDTYETILWRLLKQRRSQK